MLVIFILIAGMISAQELNEKKYTQLRGLETKSDEHSVRPGSARILNNSDLTRAKDDWVIRYGYDSLGEFPSADTNDYAGYPEIDSLLGVYGAEYKDGTKQLFIIAAIADSGYGGIWATIPNLLELDSLDRIGGPFCITEYPMFSAYDDYVIIESPVSDAIIYDRYEARRFPLEAPGACRVMPLALSGNVDDEHSYLMRCKVYSGGDSLDIKNSPISNSAVVSSGKILLYDFDWPTLDTTLTQIDSLRWTIWRTGGRDWEPDSVEWVGSTGYVDSTEYADFQYIDNRQENDFDAGLYVEPRKISPYYWGIDSANAVTRLLGQMGMTKRVTDGTDSSIFCGWGYDDTLAYAYKHSVTDNETGLESNLSQALHVFKPDSGSIVDSIYLSVPRSTLTDYTINIYRARLLRASRDTTIYNGLREVEVVLGGHWLCEGVVTTPSVWETKYGGDADDCRWIPGTITYDSIEIWNDVIMIDSIYTLPYKLIARIEGTDDANTEFIDDVNQTQIDYDIFANPQYVSRQLPGGIHGLVMFERRLWGIYKSALYWSSINDAFEWSRANRTPINENDGEVIVVTWPSGKTLRIMKNSSSHNLYAGTDDLTYSDWSRTETGAHIGCVAPRSHVATPMGHYFVSNYGVYREQEGTSLERTFIHNRVDSLLDNFEKMSVDTKKDIYGIYWKDRVLFCTDDTIYVYHEQSGEWSTWTGFSIGSATTFGYPDELSVARSDTLYFVTGTDNVIYRYGTSAYDNWNGTTGDNIHMTIQMAPVDVSSDRKQLYRIGLWLDYDSTMNDSIFVNVKDQDGTSGFASDLVYPISARYREQEPAGGKSLWFEPYIYTGGTLDDTTFCGRYAITAITLSTGGAESAELDVTE